MIKYFLKRALYGIITLLCLASASFIAMHASPGDPLASDKAVSEEVYLNLQKKWGLDKPYYIQYFMYLKNMLQGNFGTSMKHEHLKVVDMILPSLSLSIKLGIFALFFAIIFGIFYGSISAKMHNKWPDFLIVFFVILCICVPSFVIAALSKELIQAINDNTSLNWPTSGYKTLQHLLLPSLILGLSSSAYICRLMRSSLLEISQKEYIVFAKAKGLNSWQIFWRHELKNALLPIHTSLAPLIASLSTGSFVIEQVFGLPGLGRVFVDAVQQQDYPVLMASTLLYGAFLIIMVIIIDCTYHLLDPQIRVNS